MAIADLSRVLKIFSESSPSEEKQKELYREVLLMTLARASSSGANIDPVEIETIQQIMQRETGQELTDAGGNIRLRPTSLQASRRREAK